MAQQPRITDFIPTRYLTLSLLTAAGVVAIALLEVAHAYRPRLAATMPEVTTSTFDLGAAGSLGAWFGAALLAASAGAALLIYSIRRHRADDYHGRYRVWPALAICAAIMSISTVAGLHTLLQQVLVQVTGKRLMADGALYWALLWGLVITGTGARLLMDCWHCRAAVSVFATTYVLWILGTCCRLSVFPFDADVAAMAGAGFMLSGHLGLLLGLGLQARYVLLESEGRLPIRVRKEKPVKEPKADKTAKKEGATTKIDAAHKDPAGGKRTDLDANHTPKTKQPVTATVHSDEDDDFETSNRFDDEEDNDGRRLSRAERKRLRREGKNREGYR